MINSLCVLGGGTSGLLSALILKQAYNSIDVRVVKSDKVGIIGVGEGATEHWKILCDFLQIPFDLAVVECAATVKVGIHFKEWGVPDYYHSVCGTAMQRNGETYPIYEKLIGDNAPPIELTDVAVHDNLVSEKWANLQESCEASQFHFHAFRLNEFLLKLCKERGIEIVEDEITDVVIENGQVVKLVGNQEHTADFYIDSSGMSRVIIKQLGGQWQSYSKHLITNSAIAFPTEDTDQYPIFTTSTAMKYGWMWNTPVQGRWGNGYVFCDKYIDFDQAQKEVEEKLGRPIEIFKRIKFDPGSVDRPWIGNCCAIGLSSAFVEPLESSAISQGLLQTWLLLNLLNSWTSDPEGAAELYNKKNKALCENILDFVAVHYITPRDDTDFWKYLKENRDEWVPQSLADNLKRWQKRVPTNFEFDEKWTLFKAENWIQTLHGLNLFDATAIQANYNSQPAHIQQRVEEALQKEKEYVSRANYIPHKEALELFKKNYIEVSQGYKL